MANGEDLPPRALAGALLEYPGVIDADLARRVIAAFEREPGVAPGIIARSEARELRALAPEVKRSDDFRIEADAAPEWLALDAELTRVLMRVYADYERRFPALGRQAATFLALQIQRYRAGGFFDWHNDDDGERRCLAVIGYLNEGFEGGETEFLHQGVVVRPRTGSVLLFPPFWTHVHRGRPVLRGEKFIFTTFFLRRDSP